MAIENTGYKAYANLLKVTDDGTNRPLDINNNLCSESGLPQATKTNTIGDPDYIAPVYDIVTCPLPISSITVIGIYSSTSQCGAGSDSTIVETSITLSAPVTVDTILNVTILYSQTNNCEFPSSTTTEVLVPSGSTNGESKGCLNGGTTFPYDATICDSIVSSTNNTVDNIII